MPQEFQTSFIPKKPLAEEQVVVVNKKTSSGLLNFFATIIFIASLASALGFYFYKTTLTNQVAKLDSQLKIAKESFELDLIANLQVLDKRIIASQDILSEHLVLSPLFESIQEMTLKSIRFTKFAFTRDEKGTYEVKMSGLAKSYFSIALEADMFAKNKNIKDPIFSNLSLDEKGNVLFDLTFSVEPSFLIYEKDIKKEINTN